MPLTRDVGLSYTTDSPVADAQIMVGCIIGAVAIDNWTTGRASETIQLGVRIRGRADFVVKYEYETTAVTGKGEGTWQ